LVNSILQIVSCLGLSLDFNKKFATMKSFVVLKIILVLILGPAIYSFKTNIRETGKIIDKIHVPSRTREIESYSIILDAPMKEYKVIPGKYKLIIDFKGKEITLCVSEEMYMKFQRGDLYTSY